MEITLSRGKMSEDQFVNYVSSWLSQHPNIRINKLYTDETTSLGLMVNKSVLSTVTLIYDEDKSVNNLYGFTIYEEFALIKIGLQSMKEKWLKHNPDFEIVTCNYVHNARGQTGSLIFNGLGASNRNQLRIVYKLRNIAAPTVLPSAAQEQVKCFCTSCGAKLITNAKFCGNCGAKV